MKIFSLLLVLLLTVTAAVADIPLSGTLTNAGNPRPVARVAAIQGAPQIADTMTALSNTPSWLRSTGQLFHVLSPESDWRLVGGTNNANLVAVTNGTSDASSLTTGTVPDARLPATNRTYNSIFAMVADTAPKGTVANVASYYGTNLFGGGTFIKDTTSTQTTNYGTVFAAVGGGRWRRSTGGSNVLRADWFGVYPANSGVAAADTNDQAFLLQNAVDTLPTKGGRLVMPPFPIGISQLHFTNFFGLTVEGEARNDDGTYDGSMTWPASQPVLFKAGGSNNVMVTVYNCNATGFRGIGFYTRSPYDDNVMANICVDVDQPTPYIQNSTANFFVNCLFKDTAYATNSLWRGLRIAFESWQNCEFNVIKGCFFQSGFGSYWYNQPTNQGIAIQCGGDPGGGSGGGNSFGNRIIDGGFAGVSRAVSGNGSWYIDGFNGTGSQIAFYLNATDGCEIRNCRVEGQRQFLNSPNGRMTLINNEPAAVDVVTKPTGVAVIDAVDLVIIGGNGGNMWNDVVTWAITNSYTDTGRLTLIQAGLASSDLVAWNRFNSGYSALGSFGTGQVEDWVQKFPFATWDAGEGVVRQVMSYPSSGALALMPGFGRVGIGNASAPATFSVYNSNEVSVIFWDSKKNPRWRWLPNVARSEAKWYSDQGTSLELYSTNSHVDLVADFGVNTIKYWEGALNIRDNSNNVVARFDTDGAVSFPFSAPTTVDEAYDPTGWDGDLSVPTKNAIRDKIETLTAGGGGTFNFPALTNKPPPILLLSTNDAQSLSNIAFAGFSTATKQAITNAAGLVDTNAWHHDDYIITGPAGSGLTLQSGASSGAQIIMGSGNARVSITDIADPANFAAALGIGADPVGMGTSFYVKSANSYAAKFESTTANNYNQFSSTSGAFELDIYNDSMLLQPQTSLANGLEFRTGGDAVSLRMNQSGGISIGTTTDSGSGNLLVLNTNTAAYFVGNGSLLTGIAGGGGTDPRFTSSAGTITAGSNTFAAPVFQSSSLTANTVIGTDAGKNLVSYAAGSGIDISGGTISATGGASLNHVLTALSTNNAQQTLTNILLQNQQGAVTDAQVPDTITVNVATLASTVTVVDGTDSTSFVGIFDSATGSLAPKTDGALLYNASSGLLNATTFVGAGAGLTYDGSGNNGNLATSVDTLQELNDAVDNLAISGGGVAPTTIMQTNFVLNTVYTVSTQAIIVRATATLTPASVSGAARMRLFADQSGGSSYTLLSEAHINTTIGTLALEDDRDMAVALKVGATYYWTNASTGAGNAAVIHDGTGQIVTISSGTNGANGTSALAILKTNGSNFGTDITSLGVSNTATITWAGSSNTGVGTLTASVAANSIGGTQLTIDATAESEIEAVVDLSDLQGAVTDAQVPNNITIDLATLATTATTANVGDSATAFFPTGTLEPALMATNAAFSNAWLRATSATTAQWSRDGSGLTNLTGGVSDGDKGDITVSASGATWTIDANSVALGTDTTGNYAAGDAEAGAALTGDSATAFFSAGTIEAARLGSGSGGSTKFLREDQTWQTPSGSGFPLTTNTMIGTNFSGGLNRALNFVTDITPGANGYLGLQFVVNSTLNDIYMDNSVLHFATYGAGDIVVDDGLTVNDNLTVGGDIIFDGTIVGAATFDTLDITTATLGVMEFEGATDDAFETVLSVIDPTADRTNYLPNASGVLALSTNIAMVTSVTIPMGAWWTNNVADGATLTAASATVVTNTGDSFAFTDGVTNVIRTRFALPWDWDAGTVQVSLRSSFTATNGLLQTNCVFAVRAAAIGDGDNIGTLTWGTAVWTTNHIHTSPNISREAITSALTIGNTPTVAKSILWEVQRLGAASGDNSTNVCSLGSMRVYYQKNTRADFPVATP